MRAPTLKWRNNNNMGKNKNSIKVSFPWASSEQVAGSQVLIEFGSGDDRRSILVECGLIQGPPTILQEYIANKKKFEFKSKKLDYVFCCHSHADHIGLLPRLYKEGCEAPVIVPEGNLNIMKVMLYDSAKIMEKNSEFLERKFKKEYPPIYTSADTETCISNIREFKRNNKYKLDEHISFEYVNSGHIINSCQLRLWITNNNSVKKIVVTSDLGNTSVPQFYVEEFEAFDSADLIVGESTYCNQKRCTKPKDREKDLDKIKSAVDSVCKDRHGNILIPVFSLQRFQNMLTHLYNLFHDDKDCPMIYAASPLACKLSEFYSTEIKNKEQAEQWNKVKSWDKICFIQDFETLESKVIEGKPAIYCASAGMMNAGYSVYLAKQFLPKTNNLILFCGFMAQNTLGFKIKQNNTKTVVIEGERYSAKCNVISLNSFSSHMMHDDLVKYYTENNFTKIALVHGEMEDKVPFAKELEKELSKKNKTNKVICVNKGTVISIA